MVTVNEIYDILKPYCEKVTEDLDALQVSLQKGDTERQTRAPKVFCGRLPNSKSYEKYAPYIIVQYRAGYERQTDGRYSTSTAIVAFICAVYNQNEEEGSRELNNVMDRLKLAFLTDGVIGDLLEVDKSDEGLISYVYTADTAPYYAGELVVAFKLPATEREVPSLHGY